ncbi:MAG: hypothetical protein AAGF11_28080 [Myxococcota bacterium]
MVTHAGRASALAIGLGLWAIATSASAGNGIKPRIPVDWANSPCMTVVDRSTDATVHMDYMVAEEDTELTGDEVDDSRRHQFFAVCRASDPQSFMPRWITQSDIDRALQVGAAPDEIDPEDILESSTEWAGCFERINADDDRVPITFAAAEAGIDWDTSAVAAGPYIIEGYTWEPALNLWSKRPGVIKVVDDPDPTQSGPALAINNTEEVISKNETVVIEGCVSAMEGATVTAYWGLAESEVDWQPFIEDDPVIADAFAVEFAPPEILAGESVMIRVDVTDPMGRSYTNYMSELVIVLGTDNPGCADGGGFIGGADCPESDSSGDAATGVATDAMPTGGSASASDGTPPEQDGGDEGGGGGCGCRSTGPRPGTRTGNDSGAPLLGAGLIILGLWSRRRRGALSH